MKDKHLRTYLNDHLAGAEAGVQLAEDCLEHNPTGPLSEFLPELVAEIEKDHAILRDLRNRFRRTENPLKTALAWLFSKVSRLKLENLLLQYTDLTRLEELEALVIGVRGKLALWKALEAARASDPRFSDVDFKWLQERARRQLEGLEEHRLWAARQAFTDDDDAA